MSQVEALRTLIAPLIEDLGYEFVGCEVQGGSQRKLVRLYIDQDDGVGVDDCARVSREVAALMDVEDPISGQYVLEVSSPGLDRPLFALADFQRFDGAEINLTLSVPIEGRRRFRGVIEKVEGDNIELSYENKLLTFSIDEVESARLVPVL